MILARNNVPVGVSYNSQNDSTMVLDHDRPAEKLDVFVYGGASVVVQISEDNPPSFANPSDTELLLQPGFNSRPLPMFYGFRFKTWQGQAPTTVDFVAMA